MKSWAWVPHVFAMEFKKAMSYRLTFWIQFLVSSLADMTVAYCLWQAMFEIRQVDRLEGFSLSGITYYYLFATFSARIARGSDRGYLAQDIYDGSLSRYMLFPLPFVAFKFITHFSQQALAIFQLLMAFAVLHFILRPPDEQNISLASFAAGIGTCLLAGYLHFVISSCIEMIAFWQDVIWNMMAMFRFIGGLLGGVMIPLIFFPEWGRVLVNLTPFPWLFNFPAKVFLGQINLSQWFEGVAFISVWSVVFTLLLSFIWSRGTRQYTGVGI